ncbi:MAG: TonB-dependent receptor, partial [Myxococcales bacterium]|nr:TonB-dependent receptor [Myxococcales bacterium]
EVQPTTWLRILGGARYEVFSQDLEAASPVVDEDDAVTAERTDTDALPSGSLVFALGEAMNLRAGYRMSVARPAVSAVAPFRIQDYVRRRTIDGNPDLQITRVHNADLRWEWFPGPTEVLAATVFYKEFIDPYELVVQNAEGSTLKYENAEGATNYGAELEARVGLGNLSPALSDLSLGTNLLLVASQIDLACTPLEGVPGECQENYTSTS